LAGGFLGIQAKKAIDVHRFRNTAARIKTELQKAQVLALSHQSDIKASIFQQSGEYTFKLSTDEPGISSHACINISLKGVSHITLGRTKEIKSLELNIYSSGRIEPLSIIGLHLHSESIWLDLSHPLQIKICNDYPDSKH
jgi:hypothetical protein